MAIFTKDGKMYIVEGPNPLVEKQASWERSKLVFHNFEWEDISQKASRTATAQKIQKDRSPVIPPAEPPPLAQSVAATNEPEDEVATAEEEPTPPQPEPEAKEEAEQREFDLPYIKYKVLCHCLPAKIEQRNDSFYGESWGRIKYGKKFVFPCVVVSSGDLTLEFWTSDPKEQMSEKSIVYPFSYEVHNHNTDSYDRVPYDDYRWWRISHKEKKEGGWLFRANPSDFQPDFSD